MKLNKTSLVALVGSGLMAGSLFLAGPAAARAGGGHGDAGPGVAGHSITQGGELPFGPVGQVRAELPIAPVGQVRAELPIAPVGESAPIGTAGSGRVPMAGSPVA